jgi:hypothetical protein
VFGKEKQPSVCFNLKRELLTSENLFKNDQEIDTRYKPTDPETTQETMSWCIVGTGVGVEQLVQDRNFLPLHWHLCSASRDEFIFQHR